MLLVTLVNLAFLFKYGQPDWKPVAIAYLGMILQAAGMLAIGMFISTLTKNQIIAGASTFGVCLVLWVIGWTGKLRAGDLDAGAFVPVGDDAHGAFLERAARYAATRSTTLSLIVVGFFLTARSLESLRWRS